MTLKQLKVFIAVADTQSFSKAGEVVFLAQSTISQHVKALEELLSVTLFDRCKNEIRLTAAGKLFYGHALQIVRGCDEATTSIRRFQGLIDATVTVGASTIPASCLIPGLIGRFNRQYPGISLEVLQADSEQVLRMLLDDRAELAMAGAEPSRPDIEHVKIAEDRIILAAGPGSGVPAGISVDGLANLKFVTREHGSGTRKATDQALRQAGADLDTLPVIARLGSSEAVRRAVLGGNVFAFISALAIAPDLDSGLLVEVPVRNLKIKRNLYLAWRRNRTISPAASALKNFLLSDELFRPE